jgi:hypothetical protein
LLILALDGVGIAAAGAATLIQLEPAAPRWRAVGQGGAAPRTQLIPAAPAAPSAEGVTAPGAPSASAPPSRVIPVETALLRRSLPAPDQADERALPADAQVAAAPIRPAYLIRPSLGGGLPTGFVGRWGDYFFSASAGTPGNLRGGSADASFNLGFGLGDPERLLGAEVYWGIGSFKTFNGNGGVGGAVGRVLVNRPDLQVSVAGGLIDAYTYGFEANPQPPNGYGAVTVALPLRPRDPTFPQVVQFTLGGGGSSFAAIDDTFELTEAGFYAAAGVEVLPSLGVSMGWSGRSANVNLSWIPFRTLPVFVNVVAADVFAATPFGTVGVLTVGWGDNLQSGFVTK